MPVEVCQGMPKDSSTKFQVISATHFLSMICRKRGCKIYRTALCKRASAAKRLGEAAQCRSHVIQCDIGEARPLASSKPVDANLA